MAAILPHFKNRVTERSCPPILFPRERAFGTMTSLGVGQVQVHILSDLLSRLLNGAQRATLCTFFLHLFMPLAIFSIPWVYILKSEP